MLPIGDDNRDRRSFPVVTVVFIALNVLVFAALQQFGATVDGNKFTYAWSTVPAEIMSGNDIVTEPRIVRDPATGARATVPGLQPTPLSVYLTLLTSMFMHGSIAHIGGNMLYLWIFGDNIEDRIGRLRYIMFYLVTGVIASLAHVLSTQFFGDNPLIPSLGASGAISGVQGAYLLLFPQRRVRVILLRMLTDVPAIVAVGGWFVLQLIQSMGYLGGGGGVAYAAHIGGFIAGLVLIKLFAIGKRPPTVFETRGF
jgi:membrane associated rhomboid family serine protease